MSADLSGEAQRSNGRPSPISILYELPPGWGHFDYQSARSVVHLAQLAKRFEKDGIDLLVLDQNIDTSTSTGRLLFNMLASIAEFESDLRTERQAEGIAKAREKGVKFGRPSKLTGTRKQEIYSRRIAGATIGQLAKEFSPAGA